MSVILSGFTLANAKVQNGPGTGGGNREPETGYHEVTVVETKAHTSANGGQSVLVQLAFTGDHEGAECRIYLGTDFSKAGVRNGWLTALKSVGIDDSIIAQLSDGRSFDGINTAEYLDGRTGYIHYTKSDKENGKQYSEQKFVTRENYAAMTSGAAGATATGAQTPALTVTAAPAAAAGLRSQVAAATAPAAVQAAPAASFAQPASGGALRNLLPRQ